MVLQFGKMFNMYKWKQSTFTRAKEYQIYLDLFLKLLEQFNIHDSLVFNGALQKLDKTL